MKNFTDILIILSILFMTNCTEEPIHSSYLEAINGSNRLKAEIIKVENQELLNLWGNGHYLKISNLSDSLNFIVNHDLLEERDGYESAILGIYWVSEDQIFIKRNLDDRPQNLVYNLLSIKFFAIQDSVPEINNSTN